MRIILELERAEIEVVGALLWIEAKRAAMEGDLPGAIAVDKIRKQLSDELERLESQPARVLATA